MTFLKDAINRVLELAPVGVQEHLDGQKFSDRELHPVRPHRPVSQDAFEVQTLSGIADWLFSGDGSEARKSCVVHIVDYDKVRVFSPTDDYYRQRHQYINSTCQKNHFNFGEWHTIEAFIVNASSRFVMTDELAALIKTVANIRQTEVTTVEDDGISQKVTASSELNRVSQVKITPFQILKPYRTFMEIEQPESRFLLRIKQRKDELPMVAIHEADNGEWKIEAMRRISEFLSLAFDERLDDGKEMGINIVM